MDPPDGVDGVRLAAPSHARRGGRDARLRPALRGGRGAVGPDRPPARPRLREASRPRRHRGGTPPHRAPGARAGGLPAQARARRRLPRAVPRGLAGLPDGEDALRRGRALRVRARRRLRPARGARRDDPEVGQEEAQAAVVRRRGEPGRRDGRRRGARRAVRRARRVRDRGAPAEPARPARPHRGLAAAPVYRRLFALPGVPRLVLSGLAARCALPMAPISAILLVQQSTGSFAQAGAVDAAYAVALAALSPVQGRLIDRFGAVRVLAPAAVLFAGALVLLVALATGDAPLPALLAAGALAGASVPGLGGATRALWTEVVRDTDVPTRTAFAVESLTVEAQFIGGPLLGGVLIALAGPAAAVLTAGGLALGGTLAFVTAPLVARRRERTGDPRRRFGPFRVPGVWVLLATTIPFGAGFGALAVALPAFATAHGAPAASGVLWATQAIGSAIGGLWYGARRWNRDARDRYALTAGLFALGQLPLFAAGSIPVLAVLIGLGGLALAPLTATQFELTDRVAPPAIRTETFALFISANLAGSAFGSAVAGGIVEGAGARAGLVLAAAGAVVAFVPAVAWRRRL